MSKKIVKINENELVNLIDHIVTEAVSVKKAEWIAENAATTKKLMESVAKLEKKVKTLTEGKK